MGESALLSCLTLGSLLGEQKGAEALSSATARKRSMQAGITMLSRFLNSCACVKLGKKAAAPGEASLDS